MEREYPPEKVENKEVKVARDVLNDKKRTIGETIKHLRQEKLWTQVELANRLGHPRK